MNKCTANNCLAPDVPCAMGEMAHESCSYFKGATDQESAEVDPGKADVLLPWSGSSLGLTDLSFVAGRSQAKSIAVIGPASAGKTTMLAAWYLLLGRGIRLRDRTFSGSFTLSGWENIAHSLRWVSPGGPSFPVHTPSGAQRVPGLLHLAFKSATQSSSDFLFVDAPGEWFRRWAIDENAEDAAGGKWIADHSDVFIVAADSESLSGAERGVARSTLQQIIQRLGDIRSERPVALVWTKADKPVPDPIRAAVKQSADRHLKSYSEFSISVHSALGAGPAGSIELKFMDLLDWTLTARATPFECKRGRHAKPDHFFDYGLPNG